MILPLIAHACCWPLSAVGPVCSVASPLLLIQLNKTKERSLWLQVLLSYTSAEVLFYLWFKHKLSRAQMHHRPQMSTPERRKEIMAGISTCNRNDPHPYQHVCDYFFPHPIHEVGRDDLQRLLAESLFNCPLNSLELSPACFLEMDTYISQMERELRITFPPHTVGTLPPLMRLHYDPVVAYAKPLFYYAAVQSMDLCSDLLLWGLGFRRRQQAGAGVLSYWILDADLGSDYSTTDPPSKKQQCPVLFIHGVGLGLVTYITFIHSLVSSYPRGSRPPLMLLELPHVSMKLNVEVIPSMPTTVDGITQVLNQEGFGQAQFVVHSLGSFIFGAVQHLSPSLVAGVVLIDPVCFKLWDPSVMRNFCYRIPDTVMQILMHYHITHELTINHYFHRHFIWTDCVLFAENVPAHTCVVLSELDEIIDAVGVREYLLRSNNTNTKSSDSSSTSSSRKGSFGLEDCKVGINIEMLTGRHHGEWNVHLESLRVVVGAVVTMSEDLLASTTAAINMKRSIRQPTEPEHVYFS